MGLKTFRIKIVCVAHRLIVAVFQNQQINSCIHIMYLSDVKNVFSWIKTNT